MIDVDTFQPLIRLVVYMPIEPIVDAAATVSEDEFALTVGKELLSQMKAMSFTESEKQNEC